MHGNDDMKKVGKGLANTMQQHQIHDSGLYTGRHDTADYMCTQEAKQSCPPEHAACNVVDQEALTLCSKL